MKKTFTLKVMALATLAMLPVIARADLLVAIAGPMTGQYASFGDQIRKGAEMAVADINAAGGVLGQQLKLEIGDDACDPKQAVSVANTMVNKHIVYMHGHWCSGSTIPASDVYAEANIPMVTVSTNPKVTERGLKNVFRIMGRDDQQGLVVANYLVSKFPGRKVAVIDDKSAYGKGLADVIAQNLTARKQAPVIRESITVGDKDYSALVNKLKAAGVQVLAFGGYHTELGLILRQAQQAGLKLTAMGGDTLSTTELLTAAGPAAEGVLFTFSPDPRKNPQSAKVVEHFRVARIEPEGYVMYAYAAMQLFADAATRAKSVKYADLQKALATGTTSTVVGNLSFDAKGDNKQPGFVVYAWHGGKYDYAK